ncbi:MAG: hypothetical protein RI897_2980 [Verrucomicrobiota bacterium]
MGEVDAEFGGVFPDFGGLGGEAFATFFHEVEVTAGPEAPGVAGGDFPAEGDAPEHGDDFDFEFGAEVEEAEDVIFGPLFDGGGGFFGDIGRDEGADGGAAGPGCGMDPEGAVG